ncbi:MAG: hypothetical protein ABEJ28_10755 [Salinigranum sp.]
MDEEGMADRESELRSVAATVREYDVVEAAFTAKSFTDRLLIVDLRRGGRVPDEVREFLAERGLRGANDVYGSDADDPSLSGDVGAGTRHQFVDVEARGDDGPFGGE